MAIQFKCETCGADLEVADNAAGKKGACRRCQAPLIVPDRGAEDLAFGLLYTDPATRQPINHPADSDDRASFSVDHAPAQISGESDGNLPASLKTKKRPASRPQAQTATVLRAVRTAPRYLAVLTFLIGVGIIVFACAMALNWSTISGIYVALGVLFAGSAVGGYGIKWFIRR